MVYAGIQQIQQSATVAATGAPGFHQQVVQAIRNAANKTGVSFSYLLDKAEQESGGNPGAKASTSTATGLFQFTGQTWLRMVKSYGTQYGVGNYAEHIHISGDGTAHVSDPTWKKAILNLRNDPQLSAEMAGELDKENSASLQASVGGKIGPTELYLAHFLGAGGASDFIETLRSDPSAKAATILPDAAEANASVFYDGDGNPRSVAQIYQHFAQKFDKAPAADASTMLASAAPISPAAATTVPAMTLPPAKSTSPYAAMGSYMVADAEAARSAYAASAAPDINDNGAESSALFATMLISQMKAEEAQSSSSSSATATSAYSKRNTISTLGAIA